MFGARSLARWVGAGGRAALLLALALLPAAIQAQTTTFSFTGGEQYYTVPAGVYNLRVTADGARGGVMYYTTGYAARVTATVAVTPGEQLTVRVGGYADYYGGYNGGGDGDYYYYGSGGGGGATDLRRQPARGATGDYDAARNALLVAGGSGGEGYDPYYDYVPGGGGGAPNGGVGSAIYGAGGSGGTQTAAGAGYAAGSNGQGGSTDPNYYSGGGGGGGGYYGGGAGYNSGGGGGASWVLPTASSATYGTSGLPDNGQLTITPTPVAAYARNLTLTLDATGTAVLTTAALNNGSNINGSAASASSLTLEYNNGGTASGVTSGDVTEGGTVTLTAPTGGTFTAVNFASYGTPTGTGGSYALGSCHASNSTSVVSSYLLGQNTASISATNGVFGDPCNGTVKRLAVRATYAYPARTSTAQITYSCADLGPHTVYLTVTDGSGNISTTSATVTVAAPASTPTTTWLGSASTTWTDCANWSYGKVPDAATSIVIPAGLSRYPVLSTGTLSTKDLTIAAGGTFTVNSGTTLAVSGNLANNGTATLSGTVQFTGSAATQTLGGSTSTSFTTLVVNKTSGTVQLGQNLTINSALTLTSGTLTTTGTYQVNLGSSASISESNASYVLGKVVVNRPLTAGAAQSFSGLGLTLTPAAGSTTPGATQVTRTTGTAIAGAGTSRSVLRYFDIQPAVNTGLNVTMNFVYFAHELNSIPIANLALFKSVSGSAPWIPQRGTTASTNTVTKTGITDFSVWTLGNSANPLPVELAGFTATADGSAAVRLAWTTASEKNSARFDVERSTDGASFAAIGQVAGQGTTTAPTTYELLDARLPAGAAKLYYRLRQVDLDGTFSYSPVHSVAFSDQPTRRLTLVPNPARATTLAGAVAGAPVEVFDAVGRLVLVAAADASGSAQLVLPAGLPSGVYVVRSSTKAVRLVVE